MKFTEDLAHIRPAFQPICTPEGCPIGHEAFIQSRAETAIDIYEQAVREKHVYKLEWIALNRICRCFSQNLEGNLFLNCFGNSLVTGALEPRSLLNVLEQNGINPVQLVIELVEFAPVSDFQRLKKAMAKLRGEGVRFALDGFGSGYSNFGRLLELQPDYLKFDARLFLGSHRQNKAILGSYTQLARAFGATLIAKNVEGKYAVEQLKSEAGVHLFQGDYFGLPKDLKDKRFVLLGNRSDKTFSETVAPTLMAYLAGGV